MAITSPSKGNTGIAQAFMQNSANQAAPLPGITQPQNQFTVPELPPAAPQPVLGSMAPEKSHLEKVFSPLIAVLTGEGEKPRSFGYGLRASDQARMRQIFNEPVPQAAPPPQMQAAPQMSEAQRLARAINERAQNR